METYLSALIGKTIINKTRERLGRLKDVVIDDLGKGRPPVQGIVMERPNNKGVVFIAMHDIAEICKKEIQLSTDIVNLAPFKRRDNEVLLADDVYDKQIVDIDDRRLTRVNDLQLECEKNILRLTGVDVSVLGLLKRLSIPSIMGILKRNIVDWEDVQFLGGNAPVKFKVQYQNLESLHPIDIGRIIFEGPGYKQGSRVLSALPDPIAADIIEELSPKLQKNLIESMKIEDVADVVEHMPAHKAADLLVTLGPEFSKRIFPLLKEEHAKQIQGLLSYPEYSTGSYMTIDYIAIPANISVEEVFQKVQKTQALPEFLLYFYVLESEFSNKLVGVLSLYDLYGHSMRSLVSTVMVKRVITASAQDNIKESLKKMYRYNISALPVVNKDNKLLGIVTFKDAVSIYLPRRWKLRFRRFFTNPIN